MSEVRAPDAQREMNTVEVAHAWLYENNNLSDLTLEFVNEAATGTSGTSHAGLGIRRAGGPGRGRSKKQANTIINASVMPLADPHQHGHTVFTTHHVHASILGSRSLYFRARLIDVKSKTTDGEQQATSSMRMTESLNENEGAVAGMVLQLLYMQRLSCCDHGSIQPAPPTLLHMLQVCSSPCVFFAPVGDVQ